MKQRHNRQSRSELGLGLQTVIARTRNTLWIVLVLAVVWLLLFLWRGWDNYVFHTTDDQRYIVKKWLEAWFFVEGMHFGSYQLTYLTDQGAQLIRSDRVYTWQPFIEVVRTVWATMQPELVRIGWVAAAITAAFAEAFRRFGRWVRGDHILRGGQLASAKDLAKEIKGRKRKSSILIGDVPLPAGSEVQHMAVMGSPGTGKTVLLHQLIDGIGRSAPLLIYDTKGDLLSAHGDLSRDVVFNPLDARCPNWTPWNEIAADEDERHRDAAARLIADAWLPTPPNAADPYWLKAARQLLVDILQRTPKDRRSNGELYRLCVIADNDELRKLLAGTPSGRLFVGEAAERMRESVRNTLATDLHLLTLLDPNARAGEGFSMRGWVQNAVADGQGRRVFLCCPPEQAAAIMPLIAVLIETAAVGLMALGTDKQRRLGFVLDEFPTLPPLKAMQELMAVGRGYGAMVILAAQTQAQIRKTYGEDAAKAITSQCSTQIVFRVNDAESAERASELLGEAEMDEARESDAHGKGGLGLNLSGQRSVRRVVLASEILGLPDLHCYLKLNGDLPVACVQLKPVQRPKVAAPFVPGTAPALTVLPAPPASPAPQDAEAEAALLPEDDDADRGLL